MEKFHFHIDSPVGSCFEQRTGSFPEHGAMLKDSLFGDMTSRGVGKE